MYDEEEHGYDIPTLGVLAKLESILKREDLSKEAKDEIKKAYYAQIYMLGMVSDRLEGKKEQGIYPKLQYEVVNSEIFFKGMIQIIRPAMEKKNIQLIAKHMNVTWNYIKIDVVRTQQVFYELANIFRELSCVGSTIKIQLDSTISGGDFSHARFMFRNLELKDFGELSSRLDKIRGLIELLGGSIEIHKESGEPVVELYLDFKILPKETINLMMKKLLNNEVQLVGKNILVVEDHPLNAKILGNMLESKGACVHIAENGKEGVELYLNQESGYYLAILMDIRMPIMNGWEATKLIRSMERKDAKSIPIIAMTGSAYYKDIEMSKDAGMDEYLEKPVEPEELYLLLSKYLEEEKK